jgi:hypothetical protein
VSALGLGGDRKRAFIVLAVSIAVVVIAFVMRPHDSDHPSRVADSTTSAEPTDTVSPSADPTSEAAARRTPKASPSAQAPGSQSGFAIPMPTLLPPGLSGDGATINAPKHTLTIRWSSPTALGPIAYVIPTSKDHRRGGSVEKTRTRVSLTTTVYGNPDYAVAYVQAGLGAPATCEIFVDGRRTAHRTTEGPYGAVWCQG